MPRPDLVLTTALCVAIFLADAASAAADAPPGNCATLSPEPQFVASILSGDERTAQTRVALVIGNGDYADISELPNPANDARAVAERLAALGFTVHYGIDIPSVRFADCLERFYAQLADADATLLYYAGHGIQVASQNPSTQALEARNYMLAIDARVEPGTREAVGFLQVDNVIRRMRDSAATSLVFLDACRDNPLSGTDIRIVEGRSAQSLGRGIAAVNIDEDDVETQAGLYLAYATSPNQTAADGTGVHSPFTAAFLDHVSTPGEPLDTVMTRVKLSVGNATDGTQIPWTNSSLNLDFHFNGRLSQSEFAAQSRGLAQSANVLLEEGRRGAAIAAALKALPEQPGVGVMPETAAAYAALYRALRSTVQALSGHTDDVRHVAFSADETRVLTTSADGTARIWDARSGRQSSMYRARAYKIFGAVFRSGTPLIATANLDDTSRIRDAATGEVVSELAGMGDPYPSDGMFTRDGRTLITLHSGGHGYLWDTATGRRFATLADTDSLARNTAISGSGRILGTAHDDGVARLWDLRSGASLGELRGHADSVWAIAFAPDETLIGTASDDRTARLWRRTQSGIVSLHTLRGHTAALRGIEFTPDGTRAITVSLDRTVRIWNVASGELLHTLEHDERIVAAKIVGSSEILLTKAAAGGSLQFWNIGTGDLVRSSTEPESQFGDIVIGPRGTAFATTSADGTVRLWSTGLENSVTPINDDVRAAGWALFLGRDRKVAAAGRDGNIVLLDARSGAVEHTLSGHGDRITFMTPGPRGERLLSGSYDMTARVWDTRAGRAVSVLAGHTDTEHDPAEGVTRPPDEAGNFIIDALFLDGGDRVVTAARRDRIARIWDARSGTLLTSLTGHEGGLRSVSAGPNSAMLLTTSADGTARTWDAATGAPLRTLSGHDGAVRDAAFSPDGAYIVTASVDGTARIWNTAVGTTEKVLRGHTRAVLRARYSADGSAIVTLGSEGQIRIWDAASGSPRSTVLAEQSTGSADVIFTPDGARLLSKSGSVTRLWDAYTGTLLATLEAHGLSSFAHAFDSDGTHVLVAGRGPLSRWRIGPYDRRLVDAAYGQLPADLRAEIDRERLRYWVL